MFTVFNKEKLYQILKNINNKTHNKTNKYYKNVDFINQNNLDDIFTIIIKKFDNGNFVFRYNKHYINMINYEDYLTKDDNINSLLKEIKNELTNNKNIDIFKVKNNNIILPCLTNIDDYCSLCNIHQTMNIISSQDISFLNDKSYYFDILDLIQDISLFFKNTIYKFTNYILPCIYITNNNSNIKYLNLNYSFLFNIINKLTQYFKENGILLSEISYVKLTVYTTKDDNNANILDIKNIKVINNTFSLNNTEKELIDKLMLIEQANINKIINSNLIKNIQTIEEVNNIFEIYFEKIVDYISELIYEVK